MVTTPKAVAYGLAALLLITGALTYFAGLSHLWHRSLFGAVCLMLGFALGRAQHYSYPDKELNPDG